MKSLTFLNFTCSSEGRMYTINITNNFNNRMNECAFSKLNLSPLKLAERLGENSSQAF